MYVSTITMIFTFLQFVGRVNRPRKEQVMSRMSKMLVGAAIAAMVLVVAGQVNA